MSRSIKIKKRITMILTLLLLISSVPSYGASLRFSDVDKKHWAYEYIEDMAKLGYLNGYPGGKFQPSSNLTFIEAMSALSKFAEPTESEKTNAKNGYEYLFSELKITQNWEKEVLAVALFKGVISEKELRDLVKDSKLNRSVSRERAAELLAKAMGLEELASSIEFVLVDFTDITKVDPAIRKYLRVLLDAEVLSPQGKGNKVFDPKSTLSRAEMSTLMSRAYDYLKKNPAKAEVVEYEYINDRIKRITIDAGTMLVVENKPDKEKGYRVDENTSITLDGKKSDIKSLMEGQEVKLKVEKGSINIVSLEAFSLEENISGVAKHIFTNNLKMTLEYKDGNNILSKDLSIDPNAKVYLNDKLAYLKDLKDGDLVELKVKSNIITDIEAISRVKNIKGIIRDLVPITEDRDTLYLITIEDEDKVSHKVLANYKTDIYRKNRYVQGDQLRLKDEATIEAEYDLLEDRYIAKEIDADVVRTEIKGSISRITNDVNSNTMITISNRETGKEETYELNMDAHIRVDRVVATSSDLKLRYHVDVVLEGDEIVTIYADSTASVRNVVGKVIKIDPDRGFMVLEDISYDSVNYGKEVTIYFAIGIPVVDKFLDKANLKDILRGDTIIVTGTYKGVNFEAGNIQIR